jgi:hypothetical protein
MKGYTRYIKHTPEELAEKFDIQFLTKLSEDVDDTMIHHYKLFNKIHPADRHNLKLIETAISLKEL